MPLFILFVGVLLVITGVNNKMGELGALLKADFTSSGSTPPFQVWILAIFAAGALGYVRALRPVSNAFLVLIIVGMLLSNKGFFAKFTDALQGKGLGSISVRNISYV